MKLNKKLYVLDTSIVIDDPESLNEFGDNNIVIPSTVIEELNSLKDNMSQLRGLTAQKVLKHLDELTYVYSDFIKSGIPLDSGGLLKIELNNKKLSVLNDSYTKEIEDNLILAVAKTFSKKVDLLNANELSSVDSDFDFLQGVKEVILVSNDVGLRVKARSINIKSEGYVKDVLASSAEDVYKGFRDIFVKEDSLNLFHRNGYIDIGLIGLDVLGEVYENEFVIMINEMNPQSSSVGRVSRESGNLIIKKLILSNEDFIFGIRAMDVKQLMALELLLDPDVTMVNLVGKAGTGKTLLALAAGFSQLEAGLYRRILALRSLVVVGKKELGFLPGEMEDKLKPFMMPIYDNIEFLYDTRKKNLSLDEIIEELEGSLVVESTGFMRGRTLPGQFIIVDEAQNLTRDEVKTLVTRVGKGGKIVLLGDPSQIDDPYLDDVNNGLVYGIEKMKDLHITGSVNLVGKSKRSLLAELASNRL